MEYSKKDGAVAMSRDHLAKGYQFREVCDGDDDPRCDFQRVLIEKGTANIVSPDGVVTSGGASVPNIGLGAWDDGNFYQFNFNGDLVPYNVGKPTANAVWSIGGDGLFLPAVENLSAPVERLLSFSPLIMRSQKMYKHSVKHFLVKLKALSY